MLRAITDQQTPSERLLGWVTPMSLLLSFEPPSGGCARS